MTQCNDYTGCVGSPCTCSGASTEWERLDRARDIWNIVAPRMGETDRENLARILRESIGFEPPKDKPKVVKKGKTKAELEKEVSKLKKRNRELEESNRSMDRRLDLRRWAKTLRGIDG